MIETTQIIQTSRRKGLIIRIADSSWSVSGLCISIPSCSRVTDVMKSTTPWRSADIVKGPTPKSISWKRILNNEFVISYDRQC